MKLPRRTFLHLVAGAAALPAVSRIARAQAYPSRPVRIIVGTVAGTSVDIAARLMGQWLSERLGQPFVIDNRPGAGTNIGTEAVVRASPDGYTLLLATSVNAWNVLIFDNVNFNFIQDIAPVASISRTPGVMSVNPSFPAKTVPEFIAYAKANPGKLNLASGGNGTPTHVWGELFKMMAGIDMVHVPYRGMPLALSGIFGGEVHVIFDTLSTSIEHIIAGKLRPLAVTSAKRVEVLANLPTVGDFLPGYEASGWLGIGVPRNTPVEIIDKLNREINAGLANTAMRARFANMGAAVFATSPADFGKFIVDETDKWTKVVKFANIKAA
jgi:tripartite-type tricarboxylate transporter receptor subunit TctC